MRSKGCHLRDKKRTRAKLSDFGFPIVDPLHPVFLIMSFPVKKPAQGTPEPGFHKIRITLNSTNVKNLEKGTLEYG
jgi:hypothetical protein